MSDCRLLEENGRAHFMTRRFDREGNQKHHLQTLCALAHLDYKQKATHDYNQYLQMIQEFHLVFHLRFVLDPQHLQQIWFHFLLFYFY